MKFTNALAAAVAAAGTVGIIGAPIAGADDLTTTTIGNEARLTNGNIVQGWTISGLKASSDQIPYPVAGTLWEATATDQALEGNVTPIVSNLNARSRSGETYRVLFGVATPQGVNPATLAQGEKTTGKVYFDVVGENPDSVVYNTGGHDLLVWIQPPPLPPTRGTTPTTPYNGGSTTPTTGAAAAPATAEGAPKPAAAGATAPGAPATATAPGTALPAGSAGTPLPAGSQGTPLAPGSQGTPVANANPAAPALAGTEGAPQPAAVQGAPAATGSAGTPVVSDNPAAPALATTEGAPQPAAVQGTPAATGSQGTPLPAGPAAAAPTTTVVVPPPA